jgi:hypothetical protein
MQNRRRTALFLGLAMAATIAITWLGAPDASESVPATVAIEVEVPPRALLGEPTTLSVTVANRGNLDIADLGIKLSRGYANAMTVIGSRPRARIDDASTEKRLYFGVLGAGQAQTYTISLVPRRAGEALAVLRMVSARRLGEPIVLSDVTTGRAEFTGTTMVGDAPMRASGR